MEKLLRRTFNIYEGEATRAFLMFGYIFLVISSLLIIKPVSNALFLSKFGVSQLPNAFILVAIFAALISVLYSRLLGKIPLNILIIRTLQIVILFLLIFWFLFYFTLLEEWALYAFYVWVAIFAVISTSQFWILANVIFNAREAKRLFGFIGAGAIAGGILGGYLTNWLAPVIGSENLIFVCILFLSICIFITRVVWRKSMEANHDIKFQQKKFLKKTVEHPFKLIRGSRHLTVMAGLVGIGVLAAKLVDYQFSAIATANIYNEDELTAFFGFWLSNLNIVSLFIQLFLTRRVVGVFGVGTSLFFLPAGILIGAVTILISPALWAGILIKISDGSLKQSINKAGMELLALPIPSDIKNQAKTFIDVFMDSFATGVGGILLSLLTFGLGFSVRQVSLVTILLIAAWIYLVFQIRREYINSFRLRIEREQEQPLEPAIDPQNESVLGGLIKVLESGDEMQILPVLRMVKDIQNPRLVPCFKKLIAHPSPKIRLEVLENIYFYHDNSFLEEVKLLLDDPDQEIKTRAIEYLFRHTPRDPTELIRAFLGDPDYHIRGAALLSAARESRKNQALKETFGIRTLIENSIKEIPLMKNEMQAQFTKINCTRVIGVLNDPELYPYLHIFLNSAAAEVLQAAIVSAAQTGQKEFIPVLIQHLGNEAVQNQARQALSSFGLEIIDILAGHLENPAADKKIRLHIPKALASIGVQKSADALVRNLEESDIDVRYEVIRALNRLRTNFPHLKFDEQRIVGRIYDESKNYMDTLVVLYTQIAARSGKTPDMYQERIAAARQQLIKAVEEKLDFNLERIFRLLGLKYPPDDIYKAYLGIRQENEPDLRINAVEFLDNLLDTGLKKVIIPIVETTILNALIDDVLKKFDIQIPSEFECYANLLSGDDNWLKVCVLDLIAISKDSRYIPFIGRLIDNSNQAVTEKARFALTEIGILGPPPEGISE